MKSRRFVRAALLLGAWLVCDQLAQVTLLRGGRFLGHWVIPFDPPLFTDWQHAAAREVAALADGDESLRAKSEFDAQLGWCPRPGQDLGLYVHDWAGCRVQLGPLAREKTPGVRRIVTVGCSFTQGAEVEGAETWSALIDLKHAELEVANLGVAGYGADQAYLRFQRDGRGLEPDEVWLGYLPEATLRITTQFGPVYQHWSSVLDFKPLFTLGPGDELCLVPSPARDYASFETLLTDQAAFQQALGGTDRWVRAVPVAFAPRGSSWTHWFASSRLWVTWCESGGRDPARYLADPGDEAYRLLRAIVLALARETRASGARFRLIVLPSQTDLAAARAADGVFWRELLADLAARGIECIDTAPALLDAHADTEERFWMPLGHYSPEANRVVADALEKALGP